MPFNKILVAFDGSDQANKALEHAIKLCQEQPSATLEVIHAYYFPAFIVGEAFISVPPEKDNELYNYALSVLDKAKERIAGLPRTNVTLKQGNPAETILEYAAEINCDLIVIGSRGLGGIREFVLGSVSHNVVQHAKVPVLVVK